MNTQNKIFAKLSSLSKGRVERKENLGAIEDAINEVKTNAERIEKELQDISDSYSEELIDAVDKILSEADYMISATGSSELTFQEKIDEFNTIVSELYQAGIEYDQSVVGKIEQEFKDNTTAGRRVTDLNQLSFYS